MRFRDYIKEKMVLIIGTILALVSVEILLLAYDISILDKFNYTAIQQKLQY